MGTGVDDRASPVVAATSLGVGESSPSLAGEAGEVRKVSGLTGAVDMGSAEEEAAAAASGVVAGRLSSCMSWSGVPLEADEGAAGDEAACAGAAAEDEAAFAAPATAGTLRVTPYLPQRPWAKLRVAGQRDVNGRFINSS